MPIRAHDVNTNIVKQVQMQHFLFVLAAPDVPDTVGSLLLAVGVVMAVFVGLESLDDS